MAIPTMRKIQEHTSDVLYDTEEECGPLPGLHAGRGAGTKVSGERATPLECSKSQRKRTSLSA
eukprot:5627778-Amphidinium_carterae.1